MRFPAELWNSEQDRQLVRQFLDAFEDHPIVLTDQLANTIYFNNTAEALFGDRAEAVVNRVSFSLLGYGAKENIPEAFIKALLGDAPPWRGVVDLAPEGNPPRHYFVEASAIRRAGKLVCGILRVSLTEVARQ